MKFRSVLTMMLVLVVAFAVGVGAEGPIRGGELTILQTASADNLDPTLSTLSATWSVLTFILDPVVDLDRNLEPVPLLAESWETSEDGLVWTFRLREGIYFHDGTPLNAEAVAFSLNRVLASHLAARRLAPPVEKAIAIDEYIFALRLSSPDPFLLQRLATDWLGIVSPTAAERYGDDFGIRNMVGTGPFMLEEFIPGDKVMLVRNEEYIWGPAYLKNRGPAHLERVTFRVIPEGMTRMMEFEAGRGMFTRFIPVIDVPRLVADPNIQVIDTLVHGADYVAFNVTKWPFDDVRVRQAFIHAVDVEPIIEIILEGLAARAYGIIAPPQLGYWEGLPEFAAPFLAHDPERALQLFAEAGWFPGSDGMLVHEETGRRAEFEWWRSSIPGAELDAAEVKVEQLRRIGIDIELVLMEGGTLGVRRREGVHDIFQWGYGMTDAWHALHFFFHSASIGATNANHFSCPRMDALINIARTSPYARERYKAVAEAQKLAIELALMIPLWHSFVFQAVTPDVGGFELYAEETRFGSWSRNALALELYIREP